ncbi:MAG: GTP cyclohydrolase FolE2 [Pikeienuella sp.]
MNKFTRQGVKADPVPSRDAARDALETLRQFAAASPDQATELGFSAAAVDSLNRTYPADFSPDAAYKAGMPDLQNGPESLIKGEKTGIQHVGISNFRLPLSYATKNGGQLSLETSVTGSVSLAATKKGINMSRIMRSFYRHADQPFHFERIAEVLESYLSDLDSFDARIQLRFRYPLLKHSLRSGLDGYQYYDVAFEALTANGQMTRVIHLDYVYSSTCPCSLELAEHARNQRGQIATPHSQRSVARVSVALQGEDCLWIEDLIGLCTAAIPTETQVMVKREDEQAFAELNGANPIFVEDAVRLLCEAMESDDRISDFRVAASHQESLHSHDAVSVLTKGDTFDQASLDPRFFESLFHTG